ncbi:MAG TPA: hypothetical protein VES65_00710 [Solirubrobacteraceae bacterium]|nr:hypothetical protein [Solirubrobacteraceae bacterium]
MRSGAPSSLAGLLALAGRIACLIVLAWFVTFAVGETGSASARQQSELNEGSAPAGAPAGSAAPAATHESSLRRTLDDAAEALTSPFAAAVSGSHSRWTIHIVETLLALLVYGFGLGFLARFIRVRI